MYFVRHILRFFSRTVPGLFRGSHVVLVSVDHPLSRKAGLKALSSLHSQLRNHRWLRYLRIRKRLRLQPHGVRLELEAMSPLPRILSFPGMASVAQKLEDYFYYLQRQFRLMGLGLETGSDYVKAPDVFPSFLEGDCLYLSYLMVQPAGWQPEEQWEQKRYDQGPDCLPFHLNRSYRVLARLKSDGLLNQTWQEALLFSGMRRWEGYLVTDCPGKLLDLSYQAPGFHASFRDTGFLPGRVFRPAPAHYRMSPVSLPEFPHLPFERQSVNLFFLDASLRIHIYKATMMDPVNHRLHLKARLIGYRGTALQRILNIPASSSHLPAPGLWIYSSSAVLELERVDTLDVLHCDYRNPDQIRLKSAAPARPIVYGRN